MAPKLLRIIGHITGKVTRPIVRAAKEQVAATALYDLACQRAVRSSLDYAERNMQSALLFQTAPEIWEFAAAKVSTAGLYLEFGVWAGRSINYFARRAPVIYGFDSFEGLQEDWSGWSFPKGSFALKGRLPKVRPNVHLIKVGLTIRFRQSCKNIRKMQHLFMSTVILTNRLRQCSRSSKGGLCRGL